ncbi:MAG: PQQ-binding-like beta-propeller repeat protein, partial [Actinomycetia bacterium]|nr:PQQ-binding-like beta-propeller repeat protein [Actinomycetes bacterium]
DHVLSAEYDGAGVILLVDIALEAVVEIDLSTGDRTIISDTGRGSGTDLSVPLGLALDTANDRALVVDNGIDALVEVDLSTGDRTIHSSSDTDNMVGTGPPLTTPRSVRLDAANNRALVMESTWQALVAVDLATGGRSFGSSGSVGSGPLFQQPLALTWYDGQLVFVDNDRSALMSVNPDTGTRMDVSRAGAGTGPLLDYPLSVDIIGDRAVIVDFDRAALMAVDLNTGERIIISDEEEGSGVPMFAPLTMAVD